MRVVNQDEIKTLRLLWEDPPDSIIVTRTPQEVSVKLENMYHYIEVGFKQLIGLAKFFGTDRFTTDQWDRPGCPTCDFGSSYIQEFTARVVDVGKWDAPGVANV